jgi:thioredoxin reductase (NADPH)
MKKIYAMVIVGGGPGGYTAALYTARAGMSLVVLEKLSPGGQMAQTSEIDNYPGFSKGVDGFELAEDMEKAALQFGAESELAEVLALDLKADPKVIETDAGIYYGRTVVIATGAGPRELGVPGEKELMGRGVHYCAHCDGMFYKGKTVVVAGGGNSAAADALLLSRLCEKVIVVHRRDTLRATKIYHKPLMEAENVEFRWNSTISRVLADEKVSGVLIRDIVTGDESVVEAQGVFVSIGRKPASSLVAGQVELDESGYIVADESTRTSVPGVFAVGDVRTKALRQIVTAVADGAVAAHYADEFLAEK